MGGTFLNNFIRKKKFLAAREKSIFAILANYKSWRAFEASNIKDEEGKLILRENFLQWTWMNNNRRQRTTGMSHKKGDEEEKIRLKLSRHHHHYNRHNWIAKMRWRNCLSHIIVACLLYWHSSSSFFFIILNNMKFLERTFRCPLSDFLKYNQRAQHSQFNFRISYSASISIPTIMEFMLSIKKKTN